VLYLELKRKEKEKIIFPRERTVITGKPASVKEMVINGLIGFIAGHKLIGAFVYYDVLTESPQDYIFSFLGSWTGGFLLAGLVVFLTYYDKQKKRKPKPVRVTELIHPRQLTGNIILVAAVFGIIGAKLFDVIEHLDQLFRDPLGTLFSFSGLAFYGGLITAAFAVSFYVERNKIPWQINADMVAPALMLAYGIGRIGCQLSGDGCWGIVNLNPKPEWLSFLPDWMWAFNYPHNVINEGVLIPHCGGSHCHVLDQPVYPTPFYETTIAFIFFLVLWFLRKRFKTHGYLFSLYLVLNGAERLFIEQLRVNIRYNILGMELTQAGLIAAGLMLLGGFGFYYFYWLKNRRQKSLTTKEH
jgi:prolipoprotein diacylglyceryltransferase